MDKMMMRRKAMEQMMKEEPGISIKIKSKMEDEMPEEEMSEDEKGSYVQMMITPEEKAMIMKMRKGEPMESEEEEETLPEMM